MRTRLFALAALAATLVLPIQAKSLHWKALDVDARIDRNGNLHATETHAMVFDGDWNGGERRFDIRLGQALSVEKIERIDAAGNRIALQRGNLSLVDQYSLMKGNVLRWRSRLPSDRPFANETLVYAITYAITNVVLADGDHYRLDHEFAFADRPGVIERFTLRLTLDPAFRPMIVTPLRWEVANLPAGETFGVRLPLQYSSTGSRPTIDRGPSLFVRLLLVAVLLVVTIALLIAFYRRESDWGAFEPADAVNVDEAWLRANLFTMAPEVAGAAWDDRTGAAEVAGVLARLVQEKKLSSGVERTGTFIKSDVLRLKLLVDRSQFRDYEKKLIDGLFFDRRTEVTTDDVKEHYKKAGFDPASKIRGGVEKTANRIGGATKQKRIRPLILPIAILFLIAIALVTIASIIDVTNVIGFVFFLLPAIPCLIASLILAKMFSRRAEKRPINIASFIAPMLLPVALLAAAILGIFERGFYHPNAFLLGGLVMLFAGFVSIVLAAAMTSDSRERLTARRRLVAARDFFRDQLRQREPRLDDAWYPYILAFGLGPEVDKWFRAHGSSSSSPAFTSRSSSSTTSSSSSSTSSWTGGGGAFGGAGASGAWAAAAGSLAAGVASASSSGGGGGGGGFSSGGGGGGGW